MKRFYTLASSKKTDEGYAIQLDGKGVKTPSGQDLVAPTKPLAEAIVAEWGAQEENIDPQTMPLTQILNTAIDKMRDRESITKSLLKYLDTDLLCYPTKEPEAVSQQQNEAWTPWLKWFDEHFESPLYTTYKLEALKQDEDTHKRIWNYMESLDEYYFAILHITTSLTGSIVLALAFLDGEATPEDVFRACHVEENYRSVIYRENIHGKAPHQEAREKADMSDLNAARRFLDLLDE